MTTAFIRWARKHWNIIAAHSEARRRRERFARMLRASPELRAAAERHDKHIRQHRATRGDMEMMRAATTDMLRRSVAQ